VGVAGVAMERPVEPRILAAVAAAAWLQLINHPPVEQGGRES